MVSSVYLDFGVIPISGCSNLGGELKYLCEWRGTGEVRKIVSAREAKATCLQFVFKYLESKFELQDEAFLNALNKKIPNVYITRATKEWAEREHISFDPKVKVVRDIALDKHILKKPSAKVINRRLTTVGLVSTPTTMKKGKKVTQVPFGARGRKRKTLNIAFIGLQPNPDGRKLVADTSSFPIAPGRRTYSRAHSTPLQQTTSAELQSSTSSLAEPSSNLVVSPRDAKAEDTTLELFEASLDSLEAGGFGRLHYSSDSSSE